MTQNETPISTTTARRRKNGVGALFAAAGLGALIVASVPVAGYVFQSDGTAIAQNLSAPSGAPTMPVLAPISFADVVERVKPAVVSIRVRTTAQQASGRVGPGENHPLERFFREFGGAPGDRMAPRQRPRQFGMSQGSGFFISADGYVVTNNHVVENGTEVSVVTDDGRTLSAKIIGTDPKTDLALLKVDEGGNYPHVSFAGSLPRVGDWVMAVGNPFGLGGTVTAGIVSARGRDIGAGPYDDFLQIDAAVNRGNSGGPAFNLKGEVVGVNTAIASPSGGNVGIAFAIPTEVAQRVVNDLKTNGAVERGFLGVQIQPVTKDIATSIGLKEAQGAIVARLEDGSPAAKSGIRTGDAILSVNGKEIGNARELSREIAGIRPGSRVDLKVWRDGASRDVAVTLGRLPGEQAAAAPGETRSGDAGAEMGRLGLKLAPADSVAGLDKKGVLVVGVEPGSEAADKGFSTGDIIAEVGGRAVATPADVGRAIADSRREGRKAILFRLETENGARFVALPTPAAG